MLQKLRNRAGDEQGFTLIELLVVILIIGILAAIALPTFLGQQKKGQDSSAKSDARNAVSQVESCYADTQDYTVCKTSAQLGGANLQSAVVTAPGAGTNLYDVTATSKSTTTFTISKKSDGSYGRTCSAAGTGGCKAADASGNMW